MSNSQKFWDRKAESYAQSAISDEASYERKVAETQSYLSTDMHVVEFGCGTGSTAIRHSRYVKHINAIDISESMLEIGRKRAEEEGADNISFFRGTLAEFKAHDASVDAVLALNVIHLLPDHKTTLAEVARILKPGGIFINSTACLGDSYFRFIKPLVPIGKFIGLLPDLTVLTKNGLSSDLKNAGFDIENQWVHAMKDLSVFTIARKIQN